MPRMDLKQDYRAADGTLFRRGRDVEVSDAFARSLRGAGGTKAPAGGSSDFDVEKATKAELVAEAERRGITVVRADGEEGDPLVSDYREALR